MEEVKKILRSRVPLLLMMQFCCIRVWGFWVVSHTYTQAEQPWWAHSGFADCFVCVLLIIAGGRAFKKSRVWANVLVVAVASLSTLGLSRMGGPTVGQEWMMSFFIAAWACQAWLLVRCLLALSSLPMTTIIVIIMIGSILGAFLVTVLSLLPGNVGSIAAIVLLFALVPDFIPQGSLKEPRSTPMLQQDKSGLLFGPVLALMGVVFVYSLLNIFLKARYGSWAFGPSPIPAVPLIAQVIVTACYLLLLWWIFVRKRTLNFSLLMKIPFVLMASALVLVAIIGDSPLLQVITYGSSLLIVPFIYLISLEVTKHSSIQEVRILAFGTLVFNAPYFAGRLLYSLEVTQLQEDFILDERSALVLLGILALSFVLSINPENQVLKLLFSNINNKTSGLADYQTINDRCNVLAERFKLSEREKEIVIYLAKGRSKPFIAESLFISDNTVRTYTKRIYEKLNIHSRRELQELIEV
ncbi:MAG: helix-turn-helix transcriptional regulator [Coriobacteriaceae bacterium]|jgi:DNA-binding CsgD family transcriptional regulator|nr:helix-turn-helix transcriptional regulator [Coriobacteriaceae bacterium]